jgi:TRAP-type C4-dicarboxylate transport system permease small subunit
MKIVRIFIGAIHRISYIFSWLGAFALLVMMLLTFFDVLGRYVFRSPIIGAMDVSEQLMVVVVFCVLGQVTLDRTHIRADVLDPLLSKRNYSMLGAVSFLISAFAVFFMALQTTKEAWKTVLNLNLTTHTISLPIAPFYALAALGLILLFFEILFDIGRHISEARVAGRE